MNKRGQGLSVNAIILIILGIVVLVALIWGFTIGSSQIKGFFTTNNVESIVTSCTTACSTANQYNFCTSPRDLKDAEGKEIKKTTCYYLSEKQAKYGVAKCASVSCNTGSIILSTQESGAETFASQAALNANAGDNRDSGVCAEDTNKGKTVYVLNTVGDELLSVTCKQAESTTPSTSTSGGN
ncbi:MAG TPA: hypothetical protein VJZ93_02855 [Candidatus Nanoarchaeia archaeon]|nr:hypothetical protein [Candidatus Nanoarchaeia archaeon]